MRNVLTVITNPAASPAMTGTPPPKPAPHNAQVLINIHVPEQTKPGVVVHLAEENIRRVNVQVVMTGATVLAINAQVLINMLALEQVIQVVTARLVGENIQHVNVKVIITGAEVLVRKKMRV